MHINRWMTVLTRISSAKELQEFCHLWGQLQDITDTPDDIIWRWTASNQYIAKSAYSIQLQGSSYATFDPLGFACTLFHLLRLMKNRALAFCSQKKKLGHSHSQKLKKLSSWRNESIDQLVDAIAINVNQWITRDAIDRRNNPRRRKC